MREIKFKGKRIDNGEWVHGYLMSMYSPERLFIGIWKSMGGELLCSYHEVDPATVGQYTGLKDKNGKEIYEGDVLRMEVAGEGLKVNVVLFEQGAFQTHRFGGLAPLRYFRLKDSNTLDAEVFGNIHNIWKG